MPKSTRHLLTAFAALVALTAANGAALAPGQGLRFFQQDHQIDARVVPATDIGQVEVDTVRLRTLTGLPAGYINVSTSTGWVVKNLPILAEEVYPYAKISTRFNLGVLSGTRVASLGAAVDFSPTPLTSFAGVNVAHAVQPITVAQAGGGGPVNAPPGAPNLAAISFDNLQVGDAEAVQFDHPNVEAASNQCVPMSVANSLQFLRNTTGLPVPHEHKPGLTPSVSPGDDSLVGQIEQEMGRQVLDRDNGEYTSYAKGLEGKLKYLARNGLASRVQVTHWGKLVPGDASVTGGGVTMKSTWRGEKIDFDALLAAMKEGQNCEMDFNWKVEGEREQGGHAVDLLAVGKTRGQRWIMHSSDIEQRSDEEGGGPEGSVFEYLSEPNAQGDSFVGGTEVKASMLICEKVLPLPANVSVIERIDPAGHACCTPAPPPQVSVSIAGTNISITGAASWMPLTGTISATGSFSAQSTTTVAGIANVRTTFVGTYANGVYEGTLTIGSRGELPTGRSIGYRLRVSDASLGAPPVPAMRVNGYRQGVSIKATDAVKISVSLRAGSHAGKPADWWLVAGTADGQWYHFDMAAMAWKPGQRVTFTGPLQDVKYFGLPSLDGLPVGTYNLYFGVDTVPNGSLDLGSVHYEKTTVTVRP